MKGEKRETQRDSEKKRRKCSRREKKWKRAERIVKRKIPIYIHTYI